MTAIAPDKLEQATGGLPEILLKLNPTNDPIELASRERAWFVTKAATVAAAIAGGALLMRHQWDTWPRKDAPEK
jgi:hypothetical protein